MKPVTRRVLNALQTSSTGWVCGRDLHEPEVGGWRADARLHELRQTGYRLEKQVCSCGRCQRGTARVYAWRLAPAAVQLTLAEVSS